MPLYFSMLLIVRRWTGESIDGSARLLMVKTTMCCRDIHLDLDVSESGASSYLPVLASKRSASPFDVSWTSPRLVGARKECSL